MICLHFMIAKKFHSYWLKVTFMTKIKSGINFSLNQQMGSKNILGQSIPFEFAISSILFKIEIALWVIFYFTLVLQMCKTWLKIASKNIKKWCILTSLFFVSKLYNCCCEHFFFLQVTNLSKINKCNKKIKSKHFCQIFLNTANNFQKFVFTNFQSY